MTAAVRAAEHVGARRRDAVELGDDRLADRADRHVARYSRSRRAPADRGRRPAPAPRPKTALAGSAPLWPSSLAEHREAAGERRACRRSAFMFVGIAGRRHDLAVVAAVDLMQEAAVPLPRQPHFEAERVTASRRRRRARWLRRKRRRPQARHWPRARRQPRRSARSADRPIPSSPPRRREVWRLRRLLRALRRQRERWPRRATPARRGRSLA